MASNTSIRTSAVLTATLQITSNHGRPLPFVRRLLRRSIPFCYEASYSFVYVGLPFSLHSGQTEARGTPGVDDSEADDDFLARERAALGDDADLFTTPGDNATASATVEDGDEDDLLGGGDEPYTGGGDEMAGFESSFPAIDTSNEVHIPLDSNLLTLTYLALQRVAPGGSITGPTQRQTSSYATYEEEPDVIRSNPPPSAVLPFYSNSPL